MGSTGDYCAFTKAVEHLGPGYRLTHAGRELEPVLRGLWGWSLRFVPEDPAMAERDPDIVVMWLSRRIDVGSAPERPVVVDLGIAYAGAA